MKIVHVVNISGGKDSTATALLALDMVRGNPRRENEKMVFVFADTTNEDEHTYDYLNYLEKRLNIGITRVTADFTDKFEARRKRIQKDWTKQGVDPAIIKRAIDNMNPTGHAFTDMCLLHNAFPHRATRFCTRQLKIKPIKDQVIDPLIEQGYHIIQWVGVRKDESQNRSHTKLQKRISNSLRNYHPIREWTTAMVFDFLKSKKVKRNKLYDLGTSRVGCAPCIYSRIGEIALLGKHRPKNYDRIREMERLVSLVARNGAASFFSPKGEYYKARQKQKNLPMLIDEAYDWATKGYGSEDMFYKDDEARNEALDNIFRTECGNDGLCE